MAWFRTPVRPFLFHRTHLFFILPVFTGVMRARMGFAVLVLGGSLGGSVAGLGCAWMAYRLWAAGRVALCPGAFLCAIFAGCWVGEIGFSSCFTGSRSVQLSPTSLDLVVTG